jgi:ABC-type cobalamin/Fe3+-siderophores transport system ATPase subunit
MTKPSQPPLRVALVGPAGSGKTTHARALQAAYRGDVLSFATPLKKVARELFGDLLDDEAVSRGVYQELGALVRQVDSNTWVRLLLAKVSPDRNCFVDDARYYNEYVALSQLGFVFLRLSASVSTLRARRPLMTAAERRHQSETERLWIPCAQTFTTDEDEESVVSARIREYLK